MRELRKSRSWWFWAITLHVFSKNVLVWLENGCHVEVWNPETVDSLGASIYCSSGKPFLRKHWLVFLIFAHLRILLIRILTSVDIVLFAPCSWVIQLNALHLKIILADYVLHNLILNFIFFKVFLDIHLKPWSLFHHLFLRKKVLFLKRLIWLLKDHLGQWLIEL